ncbi:MAG: carboxymuconolactone decarboxylase family protein [Chloroflexota bacterium]
MTASETGYVPAIFEDFRHDFPQVAAAYRELVIALHEAGPLDRRSRRLVKLATAVGRGAEGAVRSHVRQGMDEGITRAEIEHAIIQSVPIVGLPSTIAALKWAREVFAARG